MPPDYSDETLMAFADGTLDEPLFSAVADAVEQDEALAERLEMLVSGADLAKAGYAPLLEPVSPQLEASVRAAIARSERRRWSMPTNWGWLLPLSGAAVAVAAVVVALPMLMSSGDSDGMLGGLGRSELQAALDVVPSGADHGLRNGGQLHAVATFTNGDGVLCREFEVPGYAMVACRAGAGWEIDMAVATHGGEDGYRAASGLAVLDAYLSEIGAGAPLLDAEEKAALAGR
jgi:hypothetical protein